jgi:dihydroorotase
VLDLVITHGRLVLNSGVVAGGIAVEEGRIARLLGADESPPARRTYNASGCYVLPGLIDTHVHFRAPGLTHKEQWPAASRAAAAGGVTTVLDMPNTEPYLSHPEMIAHKVELIAGQSLVDYGFHIGVISGQLDRLDTLDPGDAASIKVFMTGHHTARNIIADPGELEQIFAFAVRRHMLLTLHAEDDAVFKMFDASRPPPTTLGEYEACRPRTGGIIAVNRVIDLVRAYGTRAHILHVSSAEEVELIEAAARLGLPITVECTPHHLMLTVEDGWRCGARAKISPALRTTADRQRLWEAVRSGGVSTIGSDHAPHSIEEKARTFPDAPPGLPGVQEMLPALLTGLANAFPTMPPDERVGLIVRLCAANPAQLFGLAHRKGALAPGLDADIVVLDVNQQWQMTADKVQSYCGWSAYEGWTFVGIPRLTIRRGVVIYEEGRFGPPDGRWVERSAARRDLRPLTP